MLTTKNLFKNQLGGQILFEVFLFTPLNYKNEIVEPFRHFPVFTARGVILEWFEYHYNIDFVQYLIDNLTAEGDN